MSDLTVPEWRLLVLAEGSTPSAAANARGHLFEVLVGDLLYGLGYAKPTTSHFNVTADGIELDVVTSSRLDSKTAIAECKAYSRPVPASELTNFLGKLTVERYKDPDILGLMFVIPRLTSEGEEKAREIETHDSKFRYFNAESVVNLLSTEKYLATCPIDIEFHSDPAIIITKDGIYSAQIELDAQTRAPSRVIAWPASGTVPDPTLALIAQDPYAQDMPVVDARNRDSQQPGEQAPDGHILATVQGAREDFQYQLPTAPKFFVGRRSVLSMIDQMLKNQDQIYVFNAQSGWGKSSLALKFADIVRSRGGIAMVMDTRTASTPRYIVEVLRALAAKAVDSGILILPDDPTWASLASSLRTLERGTWKPGREVLVFFDQFENVFRSEELTRSFRDVALGAREAGIPLLVGFAWKTDFVGWTEGHPYQLRDDIRSSANVIVMDPFGSEEVTTLLNRLEKRAGAKLVPDLRTRLREYSQGLPWLLKKFADHVVRELEEGMTQEQLVTDALNVESLFKADLAELSPPQVEVLRHVARYAPIAASEVTDRFSPERVQSLVDRRLLVQVGDQLDTYWDTFRDYLNTGTVPVLDSYILRQTPGAVARMLPPVMEAGGSIGVRELTEALNTSDNVIFNLSRELRLMGVAVFESLRVKIADDIVNADDPEAAIRERITSALRKHKAFSILKDADDRSAGAGVTVDQFAASLPLAFPAVSVTSKTWHTYARSFVGWFEYAGLIVTHGSILRVAPESGVPVSRRLLSLRPALNARPSVPQERWGPSRDVILRIDKGGPFRLPSGDKTLQRAVRPLAALGLARVDSESMIHLTDKRLVLNGEISPGVLLGHLQRAPGGQAGVEALLADPGIGPKEVGAIIREAVDAQWTQSTTHSIGTYFRAWAKAAGIVIKRPPRGRTVATPKPSDGAKGPGLG